MRRRDGTGSGAACPASRQHRPRQRRGRHRGPRGAGATVHRPGASGQGRLRARRRRARSSAPGDAGALLQQGAGCGVRAHAAAGGSAGGVLGEVGRARPGRRSPRRERRSPTSGQRGSGRHRSRAHSRVCQARASKVPGGRAATQAGRHRHARSRESDLANPAVPRLAGTSSAGRGSV